MLRAAPDPKMTSISATLLSRSGTGRARGAEYSVFCTARAGVHQDQEEHPSLFMQSCNGKYAKHQETALLMSKLNARDTSASTLRPNPAERGRSQRTPIGKQTRLERHPKKAARAALNGTA